MPSWLTSTSSKPLITINGDEEIRVVDDPNGTPTTGKLTTGGLKDYVAAAVGTPAGALLAANNLSDVADAETARQNLGLEIGADVQAYDADLAELSAGFTQSGTGAVSRTWLDKLREVLSSKDFGSAGDGTTENDAAFSNAFARAVNADTQLNIPGGDYNLAADVTPALGNIRVSISPDAEFNGTGIVRFDNLIPYQITPSAAREYIGGTYDASWGPYFNVFQNASVLKATASGFGGVAQFGEGIAAANGAEVWGGNFVGVASESGGTALAVEINPVVTASGGIAYGLVIAAAGAYPCKAAIQIQTNVEPFDDGIIFNDYLAAVSGSLIKAAGATADYGINFTGSTFGTAAFASTGFAVDGSGNVAAGALRLTAGAYASLPAAGTAGAGAIRYVTDAPGGDAVVKSDGSAWKSLLEATTTSGLLISTLGSSSDPDWLYTDFTGLGDQHSSVVIGVGNTDGVTPTTFSRVTVLGAHALQEPDTANRVEAFGNGALRWALNPERVTAIGSLVMQWLGRDPTELETLHHDFWDPVTNSGLVPGDVGWDWNGLETRNPGIGALIAAVTGAANADETKGNVGLGRDALVELIKGIYNTSGGYKSLQSLYHGSYNSAWGYYAGRDLVIADHNSFFGYSSGRHLQQGEYNLIAGSRAAEDLVRSTGSVVLGPKALSDGWTDTDYSVVIGHEAGVGMTPYDEALIVQNKSTNAPALLGDFAAKKLGLWVPSGSTVGAGLHVYSDLPDPALKVTNTGTGNSLHIEDASGDTTPLIVDPNGTLVVGTTQRYTGYYDQGGTSRTPNVQTHGGSLSTAGVSSTLWANTTSGPGVMLAKSRGAAIGTHASVSNGDNLGVLLGLGSDGTNFIPAAGIYFQSDGTAGTNDMPGRIVFATTADGASTPTARAVLDSSGNVTIGHTSAETVAGIVPGVQTHGTTAAATTFANIRWSNNAGGAGNTVGKSRGGSIGTHTVVQSGDTLGVISGVGSDGSAFVTAANLVFVVDGTPGASDMPGRAVINTTPDGSATPSEAFRASQNGAIAFSRVSTTASAANAFLDSGSSPANNLLRSTSSRRYKRDIEPLEPAYADRILKAQPVWYRSTAEADRPDFSWYGLIAEDLAEIDPRLVQWGYLDSDFDEIEHTGTDGDGNEQRWTERVLKAGAVKVPDGVQYERLSVLLLSVVQRQEARIASLESRLSKLELAQ